MNKIVLLLLIILGSTSCLPKLSDGEKREKQTNRTALKSNQKVLLSYPFSNDPAYEYQVIAEQDTSINLPTIYAVLWKNGKAIDQHILNNKYGTYLEQAKLVKVMLHPEIGNTDEIIIFSHEENNDAENAEGESSESIESYTFSLLFGKAGDQLIEEIYSWSYYSFWYEGTFDFEAIGKENIYFPKEEKGLDNHLVIETSIDHYRLGRSSNGQQDTCAEKYYVKRKFKMEKGEWKSTDSFQNKLNTEELIDVYAAPTLCLEAIIGTIRPSEGLKILEVSEIPSEHLTEDGEKVVGEWIKIEFPHEEGFENIGYIHLNSEVE